MVTYLKDILNSLLGTYSPIITYSNGSIREIVSVDPDYGYIATAVVFIIILYSVLRIIGGLICNK